MIKYLGSKRKLVPHIERLVAGLPQVRRAVDLFAGTTRVAQALQRAGLQVHANDLASYTEVMATCYVEADAEAVDLVRLQALLDHLDALPGRDGYVTETFCRRARYFRPENGMRIDAIRAEIDAVAADRIERAILLTSLVEAADRVDSTTGVQMAYLKEYAPRAMRELRLRMPVLQPGTGTVTRRDATELAGGLRGSGVDLAYLDPPYNQHSYRGNYHVWETIVRGDEPEVYGVAMKRVDCREVKSEFNFRTRAWPALATLVETLDAPWLLISFNDEGFVETDALRSLLHERGEVGELAIANDRYVGARIGIHSPRGVKVGSVGRLRNVEHLFLAGPGAAGICAAVAGSGAAPVVQEPGALG